MQKGLPGLELAFEQIGRVNQYDPTQDYLEQAEKSLTYRLQQQPNNLDWSYALAFTNVLQQDAPGAIDALEKVINLDSKNAFGYAYLGFVYLYDWQPQPAEKVLATAMELNPFQAEIQALHGAALLFQGKIFDAWSDLQAIKRIKFD
jgi:Tfp pilus assembly protein PilF